MTVAQPIKSPKASLASALTRARIAGLPATLTEEEWESTMAHFNYRCAYCEVGQAECVEHVISLRYGGGTVAYNCVPSCTLCNVRKRSKELSAVVAFFGYDTMHRVLSWVRSLVPEHEAEHLPEIMREHSGPLDLFEPQEERIEVWTGPGDDPCDMGALLREAVNAWRAKTGSTDSDFSALCGISQGNLSKALRNPDARPATVRAVCRALGMKVALVPVGPE